MQFDLTEAEIAALLRELDDIITRDRYFLSPRIQTLKAIRGKIRPRASARAATAVETLRAATRGSEERPRTARTTGAIAEAGSP
jgi:hypothetical protein